MSIHHDSAHSMQRIQWIPKIQHSRQSQAAPRHHAAATRAHSCSGSTLQPTTPLARAQNSFPALNPSPNHNEKDTNRRTVTRRSVCAYSPTPLDARSGRFPRRTTTTLRRDLRSKQSRDMSHRKNVTFF